MSKTDPLVFQFEEAGLAIKDPADKLRYLLVDVPDGIRGKIISDAKGIRMANRKFKVMKRNYPDLKIELFDHLLKEEMK